MKKLILAKETLRRLSQDSLGFVQAGGAVDTLSCDRCNRPSFDVCPSDKCGTTDTSTMPTTGATGVTS